MITQNVALCIANFVTCIHFAVIKSTVGFGIANHINFKDQSQRSVNECKLVGKDCYGGLDTRRWTLLHLS